MPIVNVFRAQLTRQCRRSHLFAPSSRSVSMFGSSAPQSSTSSSEASSTKNTSKPTVKSITKRDLSEEIASTYEIPLAKSNRIVNTIFDTIVEGVIDGKQVRLANFGAFDSYMSNPRTGRNPKTGETINIPSRRRIRFKAYDGFKKA
mmetsp:Transcript_7739/g.19252  ORF Transcript_7739/g.19252 Transcript_7739/m.19252 type:complete len:147 (-) Transcript_7739:1719-2159(-)